MEAPRRGGLWRSPAWREWPTRWHRRRARARERGSLPPEQCRAETPPRSRARPPAAASWRRSLRSRSRSARSRGWRDGGALHRLPRVTIRRTLLAAATVATAFPAGASADWPSYGHDILNSRNAGLTAPAPREARRLERAWTFRSDTGGITGTPAVAAGTVVTGSNRCFVYALDEATGRLRWKRSVRALGCAYMPGSPAIDGAVVYVTFGSRSLLGPQVAA